MLVRFAACGQVSFGNRVLRAEAAPHRRIGAAAGVSRPLALRAWRDLLFSRAQARRKHPFGRLPADTENAPDSLQKQEQIQGPKNASIARFDGLGCY